jgi:hypothetical protein
LIQKLIDDSEKRNSLDNLNEMFEHMYIVAANNLEWLHLETTNYTKEHLNPYSNEARKTCIPEYSDIITSLQAHGARIDNIKNSAPRKKNAFICIQKFNGIYEALIEIRQQVTSRLAALKEYKLKEIEEKTKAEKINITFIIVGTIIGTLLGFLLCQIID